MSRLHSALKAAAAITATLVLVIGVPAGLTTWVGWPLPRSLPSLAEIELALRSGIDPQLVVNTLALVIWLLWLQLVATLTSETIAVVKGRTARLLPVVPAIQQTAARLVATITLIGASLAPVKPPPALALETATATVEYDMPAPGVSEQQPPASVTEGKASLVSYTTRPRDTLWGIAERSLGDGKRWQEIRRLNPDQVTADGSVSAGSRLLLPADAAPQPANPDQVTVEWGDHFWSIAETALTNAWGRIPTDEEIHDHWRQVVDANRDRLAPPGDPDLIYPGQVFHLPPTPDDPQAEEPATTETDSEAVDSEVTVRPGDHFWSIAKETLADAWDRQPTNAEIIPYWGRLVESNRNQLVDEDNPSLILPGQTLQLPAIPSDPTSTETSEQSEAAEMPEADETAPPITDVRPEPSTTEPADTTKPTTERSVQTTSPAVEDTHTESELTAPDARPADVSADEDDEPSGLLPVAVPIAGLGIIAAGVVALVDRLRRRHLQHRPPDTTPTPPPETALPVEAELRAAAALEGVELIDVALRALGRQLVDGHLPAPNVVGAHFSDHHLKLLLWTPQADPPDGWTAEDDGAIWSIPTTTDLTHLQLLAAGTPAPWPTMVTAGHNRIGQLLIDLEFAGAIAVTGSPEYVLAACRTVAVELASSPIADHLEVVCVGFGDDFADLERLTVVDQVDDRLIDTLEATTSRLTNLEDGVLQARLAPGGDTTYPTIIIDPSQTPPDGADRLLAAAQTGRGVAAVVGYPTGDRWQLHVSDGEVRVEPLGFTLDRRDLTPTEHDAITALVETAKDQDGIPTETTKPVAFSPNGHHPEGITQPDRLEPEAEPVVVEMETEDVEVRVLGTIRIDGPVGHFDSRKAAELPIYLALHRDGAEGDTIMEALWPGEAPDINRFNRTTSRARTPLGEASNGEPYLPRFDGTLYRVSPLLGCDLDRFTNQVQKAAHTDRSDDKIAYLKAALELVEGTPFSGAGNGYTWAWSEGLVSHAIVTVDDTAHDLAQIALEEGDTGLASWAARKGLRSTSRCEECYRNLMRAAIAEGNQTALEAIFTELSTVIDADDGPDATSYLEPETVELYETHSRRKASPDPNRR